MVASLSTFVQYRLMLMYSLRNDRMMAQLTLKNGVLFTSILILTDGLYVPKSWRRAALVVGPLALLPFVTLEVRARKIIIVTNDARCVTLSVWAQQKNSSRNTACCFRT